MKAGGRLPDARTYGTRSKVGSIGSFSGMVGSPGAGSGGFGGVGPGSGRGICSIVFIAAYRYPASKAAYQMEPLV